MDNDKLHNFIDSQETELWVVIGYEFVSYKKLVKSKLGTLLEDDKFDLSSGYQA